MRKERMKANESSPYRLRQRNSSGLAYSPYARPSNSARTSTGDSVNAAAPTQRLYLTDKETDPDETGELIELWDGSANPVPPGVANEYWKRVFRRADNKIYKDLLAEALKQVHEQQADGTIILNVSKATREIAKPLMFHSREEGETWGLAMRILARDIAAADYPSKSGKGRVLVKTRENLPAQFFEEMAVAYCEVSRRGDLMAFQLDPDFCEPWYGEGTWVTKVPGGDRLW